MLINPMYFAYDLLHKQAQPIASLLTLGEQIARSPHNPWHKTLLHRTYAALCETSTRTLKSYPKQPYGVRRGDEVLEERIVQQLPFTNLIGFPTGEDRPKVLIAAALSGHHATLLRDTVRGFARDFDPYITEWKDAKTVPVSAGEFGFDDYVEYLITFLETLGPGTHLVATCQSAPPAMVAAAVLAQRNPALVPPTITLMAGPVDTRINPNGINKLTDKVSIDLFKMNIMAVPPGHPGSGRRVYPGFFQLSAFVAMNIPLHLKKHGAFIVDSVKGNTESADAFRSFYDEYFAVLDMTESFYVETLRKVFFEHHIPTGQMMFRGDPVDFSAVKTALLTVEGGKDDLCSLGQTEAAHKVMTGAVKHEHYVQEGVGHLGVFSGSRFQRDIYPVIRDFIAAKD
jgi:poly(3-hydroxybutyrate) depolymerase